MQEERCFLGRAEVTRQDETTGHIPAISILTSHVGISQVYSQLHTGQNTVSFTLLVEGILIFTENL